MSILNTAIDYLRSSKNELTKVTWPSRQNTTRYSILVIGISVSVAAFFGVLDVGLSRVVTSALANKKMNQAQTAPVQTPIMPTAEQTTPQPAPQPAKAPTIDIKGATPITTPTDNNKK